MSNDQPILDFERHPFKVLFRDDDFVAAFSNEACAAMTAIHLQQSTSELIVFLVDRPNARPVPARWYQMSAGGNRIEGIAQ